MKQTLSLLKVIFKQNYRKGKSAQRSKKGKVGMAMLYLFSIVVLAPYLCITLYSLANFAMQSGAGKEYLAILMLAVQGLALIFGTLSLVNVMFLSKDNEIIATLPIPTRKVFTAKFLYVLLHELVLGVVIGFTGVGIYGYLSSAGILYYILGFIAVIIAPILALAISSLILIPIILVCAKLRKHPVVSGAVSVLLLALAMFVYAKFIFGISSGTVSGSIDGTMATIFTAIGSKLVFNMIVADVVFLSSNLASSLLYSILIYGGMFAFACILTSQIYKKASTLITEKSTNNIINSSDEKNGIIKALILRDVKNVTRTPMLMLMCASQIFISPIMIFIMSAIYSGDMADMQISMMFFMGTMFVCGTNYFASSSFTRENDVFNILKTLPVTAETIVTSKFIIAISATIMTAILVFIALLFSGIGIILSVVLFVYFISLSIGMSAWQIKGDLDKPKLHWANVNEGLKNNKSATIPLFATIGIGMIGMFAFLFIGMMKANLIPIILIITIALSSIFSILQLRSLYKNANRLLEKIED